MDRCEFTDKTLALSKLGGKVMIANALGFMFKTTVPVLCVAFAGGCSLGRNCPNGGTCARDDVGALVKAYEDIWHSFYDEENLARMLDVDTGERSDYDYEGCRLKENILIRLNSQAYSRWRANADRMLLKAGADAYRADEMGAHGRVICGRIYQFPEAAERRMVAFDKMVETERLERFVVEMWLLDKDDILVSSAVVPDFKFAIPDYGDINLPFIHLSSCGDWLALLGECVDDESEAEQRVSSADVTFEGIEDFEDDRFSDRAYRWKIKKGYDPRRYVSVGDESGHAVSNIISNMVHVPGKKYLACRYEVTQEEWTALMGSNPSRNRGAKKPVERITGYDCRLFVDVLNSMPETQVAGLRFFIPDSMQWSFACFGSTDFDVQNAASRIDLDARGWFDFNSSGKTHEVGLKAPNEFGLYDMVGNVRERWRDLFGLSMQTGGGSYESGINWLVDASGCALDEPSDDVGLRLFAEKVPWDPSAP